MTEKTKEANGLYLDIKVTINEEKFKQKKERINQLIQQVQQELDTFSDVIEVRS